MFRRALVIGLFFAVNVAGTDSARAQSNVVEGVQASGSIYRICTPPPNRYNGVLVVYAHGFQDATQPVQIPEDQLTFGDVSLPDLATSLGFGFATNSYSKTGLAVLQGMADLLDLVSIYEDTVGKPDKIYLIGISEGGLIATLLMEQHPDVFVGGISACGIVGNFREQLKFLGDARATFEYYFPQLIPGDPLRPDPDLMAAWNGPDGYFETIVRPELTASENAAKFNEWARVARLQFDPVDRPATMLESARILLSFNVVNLNDSTDVLGGMPFENRLTWYTGASNPIALNAGVPRVTASPQALTEMRRYNTSGRLSRPLMTMHTTRDQLVPYWQETLYTVKNLPSQSYGRFRLNFPVERYGHCNFTVIEALGTFATLLACNNDLHLLIDGLEGLKTQGAQPVAWPLQEEILMNGPGWRIRIPERQSRKR
jgi:pimeloyl-ACP methyl ester carboxylesterase